MPSFIFIPLMVSEEKMFYSFSKIYSSCGPRSPFILSNSDKSHMKRGVPLNKHICEKKTTETVNFRFSHYKSMGTICYNNNQSSYPTGIKQPKDQLSCERSPDYWLGITTTMNETVAKATRVLTLPQQKQNNLCRG